MRNEIKARVKGYIKAYNIITNELLYHGSNNLTAAAEELLTIMLGSSNSITTIAALKAAVVLKNANIIEVTHPTTSSVKYRAVFVEDDFNDTLDELELRYNGVDVFSEKTGLSITKNGSTQIAVEWTLTVVLT